MGGGNGSLGWSVEPPGSLQVQPATSQRQRGVRKVARVGLCVAARKKLTHRSPAGTAATFGVAAGVSSHGRRFRCRTAHSSGRLRSGRAAKRAKAFVSREGRSHVGVPGFRVDKVAESGERRLAQKANLGCGWGERTGPRPRGLNTFVDETTSRAEPGRDKHRLGDRQRAREELLTRGRRLGPCSAVALHVR